jgi:hypothetical protein
VLVGIRNAAVVLFAVIVGERLGIRIAPQPKLLDELLALLVVREPGERLALLVRDDISDVFLEPLLEGSRELPLKRFLAPSLLALAGPRSVGLNGGGAAGTRILRRPRDGQPQAQSPHTRYAQESE